MGLIDKDAFLEKMKQTNRFFSVKFDVEETPEIDPVHYAGGCYCRECNGCEQVMFSYFCSNPNTPWYDAEYAVRVEADDFCSYGRRRDGAE